MKKFVAIDVDGVLTNGFLTDLLPIGNELSGKNLTTDDITADIRSFYPDHWDQMEREIVMAPGFVNKFEPYKEGQEFVEWLRENKFAFKFVTSVYHDHPTWQFERQLWLERHYRATRFDTVFCKDKSFVPAVTLIDDLDYNAVDWARAQESTAILMKTPQNEDFVSKKEFKIEAYHKSTDSLSMLDVISLDRSSGGAAILHTNDWEVIRHHVKSIMGR